MKTLFFLIKIYEIKKVYFYDFFFISGDDRFGKLNFPKVALKI